MGGCKGKQQMEPEGEIVPPSKMAPSKTASSERPHKTTGKAEAGGRMAAAHHERMADFKLPSGSCKPSEDAEHCVDCYITSMCQHPYCGTCGFCTSVGFSRSRELLDYQCMCFKCAKAMNRCCACGKAFNGKPKDVSLPMNHGGSDDEGYDGELPGVPDDEKSWEERMSAAIALAEKYSDFSKFHESYPPLFSQLWDKYDPDHLGEISAEQAVGFAEEMVAMGWEDWQPTEKDVILWQRIEAVFGGISLEQFAEASENEDFAQGIP